MATLEGSDFSFDKFNTEEICISGTATAIEAGGKTQLYQI
jgi:hypothetical protein